MSKKIVNSQLAYNDYEDMNKDLRDYVKYNF